jgi:hypothetical protein
LKRSARLFSLRLLVRVALAAQLSGAFAPWALAQSPTGRAIAPKFSDGAGDDKGRPAPTVESASREAQKAINACDDNTAILCVADALTRYAAALQQIAQQRRQESRAVPAKRSLCRAPGYRPSPCKRY